MVVREYKCLSNSEFHQGYYTLTPIRHGDRFDIMRWRNEQIFHLRQANPLTESDQDHYFDSVIAELFKQDQPSQILFSYLESEKCIGYGGLVHMNWIDRNAEISFIIDPKLEKDSFSTHWGIYLDLIEQVGFRELGFHKLFTYAFDLRPHLYEAVEAKGYKREAVLREHCLFEGEFIDVVIHSKLSK